MLIKVLFGDLAQGSKLTDTGVSEDDSPPDMSATTIEAPAAIKTATSASVMRLSLSIPVHVPTTVIVLKGQQAMAMAMAMMYPEAEKAHKGKTSDQAKVSLNKTFSGGRLSQAHSVLHFSRPSRKLF